MSDYIETITILVEVQANGIIRDANGTIIARLIDNTEFKELLKLDISNV